MYFSQVLSDTFAKTFKAVEWLKRDQKCSIMVSSGIVTKEFVQEYDPEIQVQKFIPKHENNLSNQFALQANFDADSYLSIDHVF